MEMRAFVAKKQCWPSISNGERLFESSEVGSNDSFVVLGPNRKHITMLKFLDGLDFLTFWRQVGEAVLGSCQVN